MWLIRCSDFALVRFEGMMSRDAKDRPKYLILSHTWGDEEVTFSDMANLEAAKLKKGWGKIKGICEVAERGNVNYVWVDTCCIDKSSSAELTEAINSMYAYYREAWLCIAYLEDLEPGSGIPTRKQLRRCRWFTRGWTLQELIAPKNVWFYDSNWNFRCQSLKILKAIQSITNIDKRVLGEERRPLNEISVAQRMSWAARRTTTKIEDRAYSLMGIFGVNMPLIYGEGEGVFHRLQEAILQQSNDLSILAWQDFLGDDVSGILASNPEAFEWAQTVELLDDPNLPAPSYTVTNTAIEMSTSLGIPYRAGSAFSTDENDDEAGSEKSILTYAIPLIKEFRKWRKDDCLLHLHCTTSMRPGDSSNGTNGIDIVFLRLRRTPRGILRKWPGLHILNQTQVRFSEPVKLTMMKRAPELGRGSLSTAEYNFDHLSIDLSGIKQYLEVGVDAKSVGFSVESTHYPEHLFVPQIGCFRIENNPHFVGVVRIEVTGCKMMRPALFWIVCGIGPREHIWATMYTEDMVQSGQLADVGIHCGGDFRNPMTISNMGNCLGGLRHGSNWGKTIATQQTLTEAIGTKVIRFSWSWRRGARPGVDWDPEVWGWRYTIDVHAEDGRSDDIFSSDFTKPWDRFDYN